MNKTATKLFHLLLFYTLISPNTANAQCGCGEICGKSSVCQGETTSYSLPTCGTYSSIFIHTVYSVVGGSVPQSAPSGRLSITLKPQDTLKKHFLCFELIKAPIVSLNFETGKMVMKHFRFFYRIGIGFSNSKTITSLPNFSLPLEILSLAGSKKFKLEFGIGIIPYYARLSYFNQNLRNDTIYEEKYHLNVAVLPTIGLRIQLLNKFLFRFFYMPEFFDSYKTGLINFRNSYGISLGIKI